MALRGAVDKAYEDPLGLSDFQQFLRSHMDVARTLFPQELGGVVPQYVPPRATPRRQDGGKQGGTESGAATVDTAKLDRLAEELFRSADRNGDGSLSHTEMKRLLKEAGVREKMNISGGKRRRRHCGILQYCYL